MDINQLVDIAFSTALDHGFHSDTHEFGTLIALIHSELSESLEADRKGLTFKNNEDAIEILKRYVEVGDNYQDFLTVKDFMEMEIGDVLIRIFDLCGLMEIDIEACVLAKMRFNKTRPRLHGKNY